MHRALPRARRLSSRERFLKRILSKAVAGCERFAENFLSFGPIAREIRKSKREIKKSKRRLYAGQSLVYGLQGSGNVVFQHILRNIVGERDLSVQLTDLALRDHMRKIGAFETLAQEVGQKTDCGIGYARPWELNAYITDGSDSVIFPQIPSGVVLADSIHGSHSPPDGDDVTHYKAGGGKVAVILRHPLDVMTSFATKSVSPDHPDRKAARNELLRSASFVGEFAWQIESFWRHFREVESDVVVFRYEDLLASATPTIERLAAFMGRDVADDLAQELAASVGSTPLAHHGHFFEAKLESWRESLGEDMLPFFEKVRTVAAPYGYGWPDAGAYRAPELSANFHCSAYSYKVEEMRRYLQSNELLHELGRLPVICKADSGLKARVAGVLRRNGEIASALTDRIRPDGV